MKVGARVLLFALAVLPLVSGCFNRAGPAPGKRAAWVVADPDSIVYRDLDALGGIVLAELPDGRPGHTDVDPQTLNPDFGPTVVDAGSWRTPSEEELQVPFTMEWQIHRADDRVYVFYREPRRYQGGLSEGPRPGVALVCVAFQGRKWIGEISLSNVFTEADRDWQRIGYVD